jgi:hypothetical protein
MLVWCTFTAGLTLYQAGLFKEAALSIYKLPHRRCGECAWINPELIQLYEPLIESFSSQSDEN